MSEHVHTVNNAVNALTALPGVARPFAATRAMTRFLNNPNINPHALIQPARDAVVRALESSDSPFALVVHDWSMFSFKTHASKTDRYERSHENDLGYELGTALVVDAADGRPLGPVEFRLRTQDGILSTREGEVAMPPGHVDELLGVFEESKRWDLGKELVHVVDREADSVGHHRRWRAAGHRVLIRADAKRIVRWKGNECSLESVASGLALEFVGVLNGSGEVEIVSTAKGTGRLRVAETEIVLDRPARTRVGDKRVSVPGEALPMRLVVTQLVDAAGAVLAEWFLFTDLSKSEADAATVGRWYAWRWRIETYHKLLKSAGMNAEEWQQETGRAFLLRLIVASMACLTVWHLQRDETPEAKRMREMLVRLSGRQMAYGVESTAPALLAGLEKLLGIDNILHYEDLAEIFALARKVLPTLFNPSRNPRLGKMCS